MTLQWLLGWWNLIFLVPLSLALMYLIVYTVSGLGFDSDVDAGVDAHADAEVHLDADADAAVEVHVDADADAEVGGDVHGDADVHADADAEGDAHDGDSESEAQAAGGRGVPLHLEALGWIGVGKAPLSILLVVLLLSWGATGFFLNVALWPAVGALTPLASLPAALVASVVFTALVGKFFARFLPMSAGAAERKASLVGAAGQALYNIDEKFGLVVVRGQKGELYQLPCRTYGDRAPIDKGSKVLLVDYDADQKMFYVTRDEVGTVH